MRKNLMAATMALVTFVSLAGIPGTASATNDPDLTYPTGTLLSVGSALKGTAIGITRITNLSEQTIDECKTIATTATLTKNNGSEVEGNVESFAIGGCVTSSINANPETNGLPWCIRSTSTMATDEFQIRGNSCVNEPRPIRIEIGGCAYERASNKPMVGTYITAPESVQLFLERVEFLKVGGIFCPLSTSLDMALMLETDTEPANPVYIS